MTQAPLSLTPPLTAQFATLRDVLVAVVYGAARGGLKGVAADLDLSPSELSRMLNRQDQSDPRKLDVDDFVAIVQATGDTRPIQWLVERFTRSPDEVRAQATAQLATLIPLMTALVEQAAGIDPATVKKGRK